MRKLNKSVIKNCKIAFRSLCEDGMCPLSRRQMKELERNGLVRLVDLPKWWTKAEYGYHVTELGREVAGK